VIYKEWNVHNRGRAWKGAEIRERWGRSPERIELIEGKIFGGDPERQLNMLGPLLEQIGADRAVKFGDPEVWRKAVAKLKG
jgi:hypothetical protein